MKSFARFSISLFILGLVIVALAYIFAPSPNEGLDRQPANAEVSDTFVFPANQPEESKPMLEDDVAPPPAE